MLMKVLFLCVQNSARSQMAEAIARHICGSKLEVASAGSHPAKEVHPMALSVLNESGIKTDQLRPKTIDELPTGFLQSVDLVITLCHDEICPVIPSNAKKLSWPLPDPASVPDLSRKFAFEATKENIIEKIIEFKESNGHSFC